MGRTTIEQIDTTDQAMKALVKQMTSFSRHSVYQVFSDFLTLAACSISNAVDRRHYDDREKLYLDTIKRYSREEAQKFPLMLATLVRAFEPVAGAVIFRDVLGELFMTLELSNQWAGQFFTPYPLASLMAMMQIGDAESLRAEVGKRGHIRACDPAVGAGALVIAMADAFQVVGVNYQQHLHATCIDVDLRAVHMAYIQFSLLHIPAVIVHGNALTVQEWSAWYTPAHVVGLWDARLRREHIGGWIQEVAEVAPAARPALAGKGLGDAVDEDAPATVGQLALF